MLTKSPLYVFDLETSEMLVGERTDASMRSMAQVGICHLPHESVVVQWTGRTSHVTWFVHIGEFEDHFLCELFYLHPEAGPRFAGLVQLWILREEFKIDVYCERSLDFQDNADKFGKIAAAGVRMAVLVTHVSGFERRKSDPRETTALSAARARKGKPPVADYTYVRIGHYYDRDGVKHLTTEGRTMPVHLRSGHVRTQRFGAKRSESKLIWIAPVIVNYHPDEKGELPEKPKPRDRRIVT
jgi:hypothetical protein